MSFYPKALAMTTLVMPIPAGAVLTTMGTWHSKKGDTGEIIYRFKTYRTEAEMGYDVLPNRC